MSSNLDVDAVTKALRGGGMLGEIDRDGGTDIVRVADQRTVEAIDSRRAEDLQVAGGPDHWFVCVDPPLDQLPSAIGTTPGQPNDPPASDAGSHGQVATSVIGGNPGGGAPGGEGGDSDYWARLKDLGWGQAQPWPRQSGNELLDLIRGWSDPAEWDGSAPGAQPQQIGTSAGNGFDAQLGQLVQAMAIYSAGNSAFESAAVTQAPNDASLQGVIANAWHS